MSREQALRRGAALMVLGALIFFVYAVVFFFRAFSAGGFELGVATLNGVTPQQLDGLNPAINGYIMHLHLATAGFIMATAIAAAGLAWYGVCHGLWWAWITSVIAPVVGLVVALPMHWMGHFNYDWGAISAQFTSARSSTWREPWWRCSGSLNQRRRWRRRLASGKPRHRRGERRARFTDAVSRDEAR